MSIVTKQIKGNWQYGDGTPASGANLVLTLSQSAVLNDGSGSLAPQEVTIVLDSTGSIPSTVNIYYNDDLLPTGTFWTWVILTDADGQIFGPVSGQIIGTAPANLNAIIPISNVVAPTPAAPTFGPITVVQPAGTNLHVVVDSGGGGGGGGDVTITSPVDGSGNVKVAIESGISNPLPVSLPSATVTALTPPAAITGFAKESGGNLATIASALTNPLPVSLPSATVTTLTPPSASAIAGAFSNPLPVSGTFWQTTQPVSISSMPSTPVTGTFWQTTQPVSISSMPSTAVTNAGTFAVQAASTLAAETTKVIGTVRNLGNAGAAFDGGTAATVPANAVQIGNRGTTALPTAVTDGQLVAPLADKYGRQVSVLNSIRSLLGTASVQSTSASPATFITAGGTGVYNDILELILTNESATATIVSISDGSTTYKFALAGNGGLTKSFANPLVQAGTATNWTISNSAAVNVDAVVVFRADK